ncbi:MAG: SLBB domain-containing protein, partial [Synergistaceae bacterium]
MNLAEKIKQAGIIGAGGAGFPTHAKLSSNVECVIVNGAECEPLLRVDQELSVLYAKELVSALNALKEYLGAKRAVYALKGKYHKAIEAVGVEAAQFSDIEVALLPNVYPVGDEQVLVYEVLKRIVPEGGIPLAVGCVVVNAETLLNIYKAIFIDMPVTDKYITVTGAVNTPRTVLVPVGISFAEVIAMCGGMTEADCCVIEGGPIMGSVISSLASPVTKKTKGLVVLPHNHPLIAAKQRDLSSMMKVARSACCHCMLCTEVCPRNLLGHSIHPDKIMRVASYGDTCDANSTATEAFLCCECGLCEMACVMSLQPWKLNRELKSKFAK